MREAPPPPPPPTPGGIYTIPGKIWPPPARKVIFEQIAAPPVEPASIIVERWLPYQPRTQRVILEAPPKPFQPLPEPKNLIIKWEPPVVDIKKEFVNLGVHEVDPRYI